VAAREVDLDVDGHNELVLENDALALFIDPDRGGRLVEWDDRSAAMNLINVLSRRPELYHRQVEAAPEIDPEKAGTIHDGVKAKERGLTELLAYDWYERAGLTDRFFDACPEPGALERGELHELGDFVDQPYECELIEEEENLTVRLTRDGGLWRDGERQPLRIEKTVRLQRGERGFSVTYRYRNVGPRALRAWAAVENHLNLLAADAPDRFVVVNGEKTSPPNLGAPGAADGVEWVALVEGWQAWHVRFAPDRPTRFCRHPIRTVSLSEAGAESNDQGLAVLFTFPLELEPGAEGPFGLSLSIHDGRPEFREPRTRQGKIARSRGAGRRAKANPRAPRKSRARMTR